MVFFILKEESMKKRMTLFVCKLSLLFVLVIGLVVWVGPLVQAEVKEVQTVRVTGDIQIPIAIILGALAMCA
jgi:cell division septal protein FtsQ